MGAASFVCGSSPDEQESYSVCQTNVPAWPDPCFRGPVDSSKTPCYLFNIKFNYLKK